MSTGPIPFPLFALLSPRLILLPTPLAVNIQSYVDLYASLHASVHFCQTAFGENFLAQTWDAEQRLGVIRRANARDWEARGMGDFAVGLRAIAQEDKNGSGTSTTDTTRQDAWREIHTSAEIDNASKDVVWVGYAGVRDAIPLGVSVEADGTSPPWTEMIEVRYGFAQEHWGKGLGSEAARTVMGWAVARRGTTRFIAGTRQGNEGSEKVLRKLGFTLSGTEYWKDYTDVVEWHCRVAGSSEA